MTMPVSLTLCCQPCFVNFVVSTVVCCFLNVIILLLLLRCTWRQCNASLMEQQSFSGRCTVDTKCPVSRCWSVCRCSPLLSAGIESQSWRPSFETGAAVQYVHIQDTERHTSHLKHAHQAKHEHNCAELPALLVTNALTKWLVAYMCSGL